MSITAKIIEDSVSPEGHRITTFLLRYPRFVHAELMTHRMFSRNASSSRAIPVKRLLADIRKDPATFTYWGANQKGMQASQELTGFKLKAVKTIWYIGMLLMTSAASIASKLGAHKQTVNRMVEPWSHISVVVTSTNYANWFALRDHADAMPEIAVLAGKMRSQYNNSTVKILKPGEWHLPFVDDYELYSSQEIPQEIMDIVGQDDLNTCAKIAVSVARCARTSYMTHDGRSSTIEEDLQLFKRLVGGEPLHASPCEHQATPDTLKSFMIKEKGASGRALEINTYANPDLHGNFDGFIQYRKTLTNECVHEEPHTGDQHE